jgi:dihydroorotate dehydrogenase (fumarate)
MKNIKVKYMGIELENPIIIGASDISLNPDSLKRAEDSGAGAIVFKSLFEEQIQLDRLQFDEKMTEFDNIDAEMVSIHPHLEHAGPEEHLVKLRNARESISVPLFASLNAVNDDTWIKYAGLLSETGVNGIELNFYQTPSDFNTDAKEVEAIQINIVRQIKKNISIPVSVKLSPDYSNILNFISQLDKAGVDAFVLFNAFFQPDINISDMTHIKSFDLSKEGDYRKSLRYAGLLHGNIKADICGSHGIHTGADVIKLLLAGATCVQMVSSLYKNGFSTINLIKSELEDWMDKNHFMVIDDFRGRLSKNKLTNSPFVYKRAQYADLLLNSDNIFGSPR